MRLKSTVMLRARLIFMDNVVAVPHIAAGTRDAYATKMRAAFANMQRVARGVEPINQVEF